MFVVGASKHRITEMLFLDNWQWNIMDPYPNVKEVNSVKMISYNRGFYVCIDGLPYCTKRNLCRFLT